MDELQEIFAEYPDARLDDTASPTGFTDEVVTDRLPECIANHGWVQSDGGTNGTVTSPYWGKPVCHGEAGDEGARSEGEANAVEAERSAKDDLAWDDVKEQALDPELVIAAREKEMKSIVDNHCKSIS